MSTLPTLPVTPGAPPRLIRPGRRYLIHCGALLRPALVLEVRKARYGGREAYIAFEGQDKRLDSWVPEGRVGAEVALDGLEPVAGPSGGAVRSPGGSKRRKLDKSLTTPTRTSSALSAAAGSAKPSRDMTPGTSTPDREHAAITRVRNFEDVRVGEYLLRTWYFSPYPVLADEATSAHTQVAASLPNGTAVKKRRSSPITAPTSVPSLPDVRARTALATGLTGGARLKEGSRGRIWVCDLCFRYMRSRAPWEKHSSSCQQYLPPGRRVYQRGSYTIWEVDGAVSTLYCQNLSLFGKLFIDHKSVFFHVENFLFYIVCDASTSYRDQPMAFFSKEKLSFDDYNLACIVTFPPFQGKGFGKLLIEFSYFLTRHPSTRALNASPGTPERPLSDLGLKGYLAYWASTILRYLRTLLAAAPPISAKELERRGSHAKRPSVDARSLRRRSSGYSEVNVQDVDGIRMMKQDIAAYNGQYALALTLSSLARACHLRVDDTAFTLAELGLLRGRRPITLPTPPTRRKGLMPDGISGEQVNDEFAGESGHTAGDEGEAIAEEWDGVEVVMCKDEVESLCAKWDVRDMPMLDEQDIKHYGTPRLLNISRCCVSSVRLAIMPDLIPSSFLPHLPRTQATFEPLKPADLLAHISVLRKLYIPPIHGGLVPADAFYDDGDDDDEVEMYGKGRGESSRPSRTKTRRSSSGLADNMSGLGLDIPTAGTNGRHDGSTDCCNDSMLEEEGEDETDQDTEEEEEPSTAHLDPFERDWAQKWLEGVFRRAQTWIEEHEPPDEATRDPGEEDEEGELSLRQVEVVLRDATAALAMMAGTSAAGSLTRHLLFPVHPDLAYPLRTTRKQLSANPNLSPETQAFLASLSTSPVSPLFLRRPTLSSPPPPRLPTSGRRRASTVFSETSELSSSPDLATSPRRGARRRSRRLRPAVPLLLHDAPMGDHLGVGMQTWGSAILLGREMALRPERFGLVTPPGKKGVRVLELGAGTGLLSILCRKILDLQSAVRRERPEAAGMSEADDAADGLVVATDFLPNVLDNLKVCVDLNFPAAVGETARGSPTEGNAKSGMHIAKLDWTTFPAYMAVRAQPDASSARNASGHQEETGRFMDEPFDLVLASDCVYDPTHAEMLRQVAGWVVRLPDPALPGDQGGTFHILSPLRPTFTPELDSIDQYFPRISTYTPVSSRVEDDGEGLGRARQLKLGVRGEGKRSVRGRKGEGRVDETLGYWWWEVGWG